MQNLITKSIDFFINFLKSLKGALLASHSSYFQLQIIMDYVN